MTVHTLQVSMNRGELTPYVHARVDIEHYQAGLAVGENIVVLRYGGFTRAPGTLYGGPAKHAARKARFLPFEFNVDQVYAIEAGHLYFRFWVMGPTGPEQVMDNGSPYEIAAPYAEEDLSRIQLRQSGDVLYLVCRGYPVKLLRREGETNWIIDDYEPQDGPYLKINTTDTVLTVHGTGAIHPTMTSNTTPSGTVSSSDSGAADYQAFDGNNGTDYTNGASNIGWLKYSMPAARVCDAYWIRASSGEKPETAPISWEFQGSNNDVDWITLDSRSGEPIFSRGEVRFFEFANETAYQHYRISWSGTGYTGQGETRIAEMGWHWAGDTQPPISVTASGTDGINNGDGFQSTDVGRSIRILGPDGHWRWLEVVSVVSPQEITAKLYGQALQQPTRIANWRMGALSQAEGDTPSAIAIYEDRLVLGGIGNDPISGYASAVSDYDSFRISAPLVADDGVSFRLTGGRLNAIHWMLEDRDIVAGTAGSLRAVGRNESGRAFGPDNVRQRPQTVVTSSPATPISIENMILFLDGNETRLYEAAYTYEADAYIARELSALNEHLFGGKVKEITYQSHPNKVIWGRRADGKLIAATYDREQKVFGATLVDFGGEVESVMSLPGETSTDVFMIVKREINGQTVRYVETLAEFYREEFTALGVPVYASSALIYSGAPINQVTGLDHLEGETVGIWGDERDLGDAVVAGGSITLPHDIEAEQIVIGKRMPWKAQTLRIDQYGQRDGTGLGRKMSIVEASIDLYEAAGVKVGSMAGTNLLLYEDDIERSPYDPTLLRTGMIGLTVEDSWANNGQAVIEGDRMYPATVRGISLSVDGEP